MGQGEIQRLRSTMRLSLVHVALLLACFCVFSVLTACDDGDQPATDVMSDAPEDVVDTADDVKLPPCASSDECDNGQVCNTDAGVCQDRCTENSCGEGETCDMSTGLCVEGAGCENALQCETDEVCNGCRGLCEALGGDTRCETDVNCSSSEYCEPCRGVCQPKKALCEACLFNRECGEAGDRCVDIIAAGGRFCAQSCTSLLDCPDGYACEGPDNEKQCIPSSGDCTSPSACDNDEACPTAGDICRRGQCVPGCTDGACPSMQVCDRGRCLAPCDVRAESCPAPTMCDTATGKCKIDGECRSSRDCFQPAMYCDVTQQKCVDGCERDDDCKDATQECAEGACKRRGCKGAYACAFGQVCDVAAGQCMDDPAPHCSMCDPMTEGSCGAETNKCITLQDDMGNDAGSFCMLACNDADPDNLCPQGYQCTELKDQDGNPAGRVCTRDCNFDPFEP